MRTYTYIKPILLYIKKNVIEISLFDYCTMYLIMIDQPAEIIYYCNAFSIVKSVRKYCEKLSENCYTISFNILSEVNLGILLLSPKKIFGIFQ